MPITTPEFTDISVTTPTAGETETYTVIDRSWYMVSCNLTGGGGGGGAGDDTGGVGGGGGGQSAELLRNACSILLNPGDTIAYVVGSGGAGASTSAEDGGNGTPSTLDIYRGTYPPVFPDPVPTLLISFNTENGIGGTSGTSSGIPGSGGAGGNGGAPGADGEYGPGGAGGGLGSIGVGGAGGSVGSNPGIKGGDGQVRFLLVAADIMGSDAGPYVGLAATTCTVNSSTLYGDVGSLNGTTLTSSTVVLPGIQHVVNDTSTQNAVTSSLGTQQFLLGSNVTPFTTYTGQALGGAGLEYLEPGIYNWLGSANITNTFTLSGQGLYVFQSSGTWTTLANTNIDCVNGARPENAYFVSSGNITINSTPSPNQIFGNFIAGGDLLASGPITNILSRFHAPAGSVNIGQVGKLALPDSWCYAKGTKILTTRGYVAIEDIQTDDLVVTRGVIDDDGNVQDSEESAKAVTYVGKFVMSSLGKHSYPVCFKAGSLGTNTPFEDLVVSPNHAILIHGRKTSANWFINNDTVYSMSDLNTMEYYVIELTDHSVIVANGVLSESMLGDRKAFVTVCKNESLIASMLPVA